MSHEHYNALCVETNGNLAEATTRDEAWTGMKPMKDRTAVNQLLITQFIEYVQIYKGFETSYDQILQPQKRVIIKQLLGTVVFYSKIFSDLNLILFRCNNGPFDRGET